MFGQQQGGAEGASQRYVTEATTQPLGKQTSMTGKFFAGNRLRTPKDYNRIVGSQKQAAYPV
jgi:hypothetical protein